MGLTAIESRYSESKNRVTYYYYKYSYNLMLLIPASNPRSNSQLFLWTSVSLLILNTIIIKNSFQVVGFDKSTENMESYVDFCSYEGHLKTEKNWFGFLVNLTVLEMGRLTFELSYPAEKCCQNILFYLEEQVSAISTHMNCWQKEYLLHPEDDQLLRLTPSFSWSGCHVTKVRGVPTYVCKGGRSLTNAQSNDGPTTWYIAVSNCAALYGLELDYQIEMHGHSGPCHAITNVNAIETITTRLLPTTTTTASAKAKAASLMPRQAELTFLEKENMKVCTMEGIVNTTYNWVGFIRNLSLVEGGGFYYEFTYPYSMQIQNIILYEEEDINKLYGDQNCWQKESIISSLHVPDKILDLSFKSTWNGCMSMYNSHYGNNLTCKGEKRFDEPQKIFIAVSNCRSSSGLLLYYKLDVFGFSDDELCNENKNFAVMHKDQSLFLQIISIFIAYLSIKLKPN